MIVDVKVPEAGESISEGILLEWHKKSGEFVKSDEPLFELETDKITMTVAAESDGEINIQIDAGERVVMGQVVATLDTEKTGDVQPQLAGAGVDAAATEEAAPAGAADRTGPKFEDQAPSVRRMLAEYEIEPGSLAGTGKDGRITKEDMVKVLNVGHVATRGSREPSRVEEAPPSRVESPLSAPSPAPDDDGAVVRQTRTRMSPLRKRIAERLVQSQQTAAILTTFNEADMSAVIDLRQRWKEPFGEKYGIKLGFMSFFVKAVVDALQTVPALNAQIDGDEIVQNHFYDIGVAVGTEHGLVVPIIRDADHLSFADIELRIADFANRAKGRRLELHELEGGCYTISNGGVYGSMLSTPILNPPQSGILGLHAIKKRPVAVDDRIEIRPMMYLAQSYDHRLVDGSEAVTFLKRVVECIENPARLMLEI
jgi:2-oxoglutarate dehydrogenase E2 component (dihydrolipoamide succinyltransferase)